MVLHQCFGTELTVKTALVRRLEDHNRFLVIKFPGEGITPGLRHKAIECSGSQNG